MAPKSRPKLTHFLLLPLATSASRPQLQSSISRFAAEVTAPKNNESGEAALVLPAKAIRPIGSIHLTIGVMSLTTPQRVDEACKFLKSLDIYGMLRSASNPPPVGLVSNNNTNNMTGSARPPSAAVIPPEATETPIVNDAPPPPLLTNLIGLHSFSPPTRTSSLHAIPRPPSSSSSSSSPYPLHPFVTAVNAAFTTANFLPKPSSQSEPLTLHATLINTIYARPLHHALSKSEKKRWGKGSMRFDASRLLDRWQGEVWARDVRLEKVAICEMGVRKVRAGDDGDAGEGEGGGERKGEGEVVDAVYREIASVELP